MRYTIIIQTLFLLSFFSCSNPINGKKAPYTAQTELIEPSPFYPNIISTTNGISFSLEGDKLYISKWTDRKARNGRTFASIFLHQYENEIWTQAKEIDFGIDIDAYHPVLSPDGTILFFNSRSHPEVHDSFIPHNIWKSEWLDDKWSTPKIVEIINGPFYDSYPSIAKNNNFYFNSDRNGGKGGMDIYLSKFENGGYLEPENLTVLNTPEVENDLVVDPNEKFIIFNRYIDSTKQLDLYIAHKKHEGWGSPQKLDIINADDKWELTPTISPDGKYFFYELDNTIMQIELDELISN